MSTRHVNWAVKVTIDVDGRPGVTAVQAVLTILAHHANTADRSYPTVETIAAETKIERRTVQRALRVLERVGLIEADGPRSGGFRPTTWRLRMAENPVPGTPSTASPGRRSDEENSVPGSENSVPGSQNSVPGTPRTSMNLHEQDRAALARSPMAARAATNGRADPPSRVDVATALVVLPGVDVCPECEQPTPPGVTPRHLADCPRRADR